MTQLNIDRLSYQRHYCSIVKWHSCSAIAYFNGRHQLNARFLRRTNEDVKFRARHPAHVVRVDSFRVADTVGAQQYHGATACRVTQQTVVELTQVGHSRCVLQHIVLLVLVYLKLNSQTQHSRRALNRSSHLT
jgi:hypothetical protein